MSTITPDQMLRDAAATFEERGKIYGDNWLRIGPMLAALFPQGVMLRSPEDFNRFHLFMLKCVKLTRYGVTWDQGGHLDSIHDDVVYSAMLECLDRRIEETEKVNIGKTLGLRSMGAS